MITTTLNRIRQHSPCTEGWKKLLEHLGQDFDRDQEFPLSVILESNGIVDTAWAVRAAVQDPAKVCLALAIVCAEAVLPFFEAACPDDRRPRLAIEAAKGAGDINASAAARAAYDASAAATTDRVAANAATDSVVAKVAYAAARAADYAAHYAADYDSDYYAVDYAYAYATTAYAAAAYAAKVSNIDLAAVIKEVLDNA